MIKDPIGDKGARLSAGVTLPGRLLVMTPGQAWDSTRSSRRIEDETQRAVLMSLGEQLLAEEWDRLIPGRGIPYLPVPLLQGASLEELAQDAHALAEVWRCIEDRRKSARPPTTLYRDPGTADRTRHARDIVRGDVGRVLIDDAGAAEAARAYCRKAMPGAETHIENAPGSLFDDLRVWKQQIARLTSTPRGVAVRRLDHHRGH